MALVKGPNGQVIDVLGTVASGLVGGGHAVYVDASGEPTDTPTDGASDEVKGTKGSKG